MASNLPPGCSVSSIPGNRPEDADFENACEMATAVCKSALPRIFREIGRSEAGIQVIRPGLLNDDQAEKLVEAIASALITAFDNGREKGYQEGKMDAATEEKPEPIGYCPECKTPVYSDMGYCGVCSTMGYGSAKS